MVRKNDEKWLEELSTDELRKLKNKIDSLLAQKIEQPVNTKIYYLYRDAENNKSFNECVIPGVLTPEQKQTILDCLHEGDGFIPSEVGLPELRNWEWDNSIDHPFFELDEDSFAETSEKADVDVTAEELVAAFVENKDKWEALGVEYAAQFEEDLGEDLEEEFGEESADEFVEHSHVAEDTLECVNDQHEAVSGGTGVLEDMIATAEGVKRELPGGEGLGGLGEPGGR